MRAPGLIAVPRFRTLRWALLCFAAGLGARPVVGQISLSTAVNLALRNSAKVKSAQADVARAQAVLAESKEAFVPAVNATGGVGKSTGAPLDPPVVFSIAAQSLVFNSSQGDYIRAARAGYESAQLSLDAVRGDAVEDVTNTYIALDNALRRQTVQNEALTFARQLVSVAEDRFSAGVDPHVEVTKARHTEAQIELEQLLVQDEVANNADHLARLTGLVARGLATDHNSIPHLTIPASNEPEAATAANQTIGLSAAFAAARAKAYTARGERHYLLRPQVAFSANYSRISTAFTTYTQYYPGFGAVGNSFNSLNLGVGITVPILDMVHRAKAREAAADAAHSLYDAQLQQMQFLEGRGKLRHSAGELAAREHLAELDRDLAQDQLDAVVLRLQAAAGSAPGEQMTPKDEQNARLQLRLRTLDMLNAELQLQQTEVTLLHQEGSLTTWLAGTVPSPTTTPGSGTPDTATPLSPTVGMSPGGTTPAGTAPTPPTVGTSPNSLPSAPVTHPAPGTPASTPPSTPSVQPHP